MEELRILLLGAGNRVSLCEWLIEAGKKYNKKVNLFSVEIKNPVPISQYATIILGEKANSPNFEQSIIDTIKKYSIQIVIPLMDSLCTSLSKYRENIEKETGAWLVVSSYEICNTMEDKLLSEQWFLKHKVNVPIDIRYPRIFKSIRGYGSRDQFIIRNALEYRALCTYKDLSDYIDQPVIKGPEFTVDAYVDRKGNLVGAVSRERLEVINGEVSRGVTNRNEDLLKEVKRILSIPGFFGPITLQAIRSNEDRKWYFLEINPRAGGGMIQSLKAGANYCECLIAEYLNLNLPDCSNWEEGLLMMRCNREVWSHGHNL